MSRVSTEQDPILVVRDNVARRLKPGTSLDEYLAKYPSAKVLPAKTKSPSISTMRKWMNDGIARATDGCKIEPDGICEHGHPSWILAKGLI